MSGVESRWPRAESYLNWQRCPVTEGGMGVFRLQFILRPEDGGIRSLEAGLIVMCLCVSLARGQHC